MAMIQVPASEIAGYRTGPAWFSARPDKAFPEYMAQWMDQQVDGALGGETFRGFRITVNYRAETAAFERWFTARPACERDGDEKARQLRAFTCHTRVRAAESGGET